MDLHCQLPIRGYQGVLLQSFPRGHRRRSVHYFFGLVVLLVFYIRQVEVQPANPLIVRSCQDPLIRNHSNKYTHSYCYHACDLFANGISDNNDTTVCTPNGDCLCSYPCSNDAVIVQPAIQYDQFICNPPSAVNDPPDPDPTALPRCMANCATQCPGGTGTICGEVDLLNAMMNAYAKICTCYCPVQRCETATATTTTRSLILLPKVPLLKGPLWVLKKFKWKLLLLKFFKLCLLTIKLCGLWILNIIFLAIYSFLFYEWISWEYRQVLFGVNYILSFFRRSIFSYLDF